MNATVRPEVDVYIQDALSQTANWLPRWLDQVSVSLKNLEAAEPGAMERKALNTARLEADRHRESLVEAYRAELEASTRPQQAGAGQDGKPRVSFDELELMGDDQVQETVEFARLQQVVEMTLEDLDAELNARMCSALGLQQIRRRAYAGLDQEDTHQFLLAVATVAKGMAQPRDAPQPGNGRTVACLFVAGVTAHQQAELMRHAGDGIDGGAVDHRQPFHFAAAVGSIFDLQLHLHFFVGGDAWQHADHRAVGHRFK
mgnify:CR=1 FL=1